MTEATGGWFKRFLTVGDLRTAGAWRRLLIIRLPLLLALGLVLYVLVTFVQVWRSSHHDGAREADVVVVLGAAQYDGRPSEVLQGRLDHALEIYEAGQVDQIVVTGGGQEGDRFTEATAGANYLIGRQVPDEDIIREVQGTNTWESLAAVSRVLRERGLTDVVMVTDGYHALRVEAIAEDLGLDASVSPSRPGGSAAQLVRETAAVSVGRVIGFRRMVNIDDRVRENGMPVAAVSLPAGPMLCDDRWCRLK